MPMPDVDPFDFEYMNHDPSQTVGLGKHTYDDSCDQRTKERHDHPIFGEGNRWVCTREKGHMGRHEAGYDVTSSRPSTVVASWADKPE